MDKFYRKKHSLKSELGSLITFCDFNFFQFVVSLNTEGTAHPQPLV